MKAELIDISTCKKSLDIEIPLDVVDNEGRSPLDWALNPRP